MKVGFEEPHGMSGRGSNYLDSQVEYHADIYQPVVDGILAVSLIIHSHIGFDSIVVDYLHPRKFPVIGPMATWALRGLTGLAVWGVYEFNTNDVGKFSFHNA